MSAIPRSRSLRKPTATSQASTGPDVKASRANDPSNRLPVRPSQRTAPKPSSSAVTAATSSSASGATALRSGRLVSSTIESKPSSKPRMPTQTREPVKKDATPYPPLTSATRPQVPASRPTSAGSQTSQIRRAPTHTRSRSTVTSTNASMVLRPPSQGQPSSGASAGSRALHARKASVDKPSSAGVTTTASAQPQNRLRPAFTTLQQHFSPAKNLAPKPLTASYLAPPSPSKLPANVAASAETSRLQAELLQLHLLDNKALDVEAQWNASAKSKLGERFAQLARASNGLREQERTRLESENLSALKLWDDGAGLDEKVQVLDAVTKGVWSLTDAGGRYARVVRRFERWADNVYEIEKARSDKSFMLQNADALFVGQLDDSWKNECSGMVRKLEDWRRQLRELGPVPDDGDSSASSLAHMVGGLGSLVHGMLAELGVMEEMEQEALAREDEWVERANRHDDADTAPTAGAIWRII